MMATRPSGGARAAEAISTTHEEKNIPGVGRDAMKEERRPLLDLDDVEQLESELAACFDAPPPPPLMRRGAPAPSAVPRTGPSHSGNVDTQYVTPPVVTATLHRDQQQQEDRTQGETAPTIEETQTRVADFSSLYSPHRAVSSSQLYPAFVPATAPSSQAIRTDSGVALSRAAAEPSAIVQAATAQVAAGREAMANIRAAAMGQQSGPAAATGASESSVEVVEELLSENEKLRLIIQDMSEELERVSRQGGVGNMQSGPTEPVGAVLPPAAAATSHVPTASPSRSLASAWAQYPGAQAEANRRRNEERQRQQQQQQQQQQQEIQQQLQEQEYTRQQQQLGRSIFVHFKCDNCPQWLKVPGHAQLVFCPTCSHTSQMTAASTIHYPPNNTRATGGRTGQGAARSSDNQGEQDSGFLAFFKNVWFS